MAKHNVVILWGDAPEKGDQPETYSFPTGAEAAAFLQGVDAAIGWGDYQYAPEQCAKCGEWGEHCCDEDGEEDSE